MRMRLFGLVVLGMAAAIGAPVTAQVSFQTAATDSIPTGAESIIVANLDGDPFLDLVVPEGQSAAVGVLYGRGDGTFEPQVDYIVGTSPVAVAVGNFDADSSGRLDIATIDSNSQGVSVILGLGGREFATEATISDVGITGLSGIAAADLDGDSKLDIAIASSEGQGRVALLRGQGDGTFLPFTGSPFISGTMTRAVAIKDIDQDTRPDVLSSNHDAGTIAVLLNKGDGLFQAASSSPFPAGDSPLGIAVGDWDTNGTMDVVVANRNSDRFSLLRGSGTGSFAAPVSFPSGSFPAAVVAADFDSDGNPDVAVANRVSYDVTIAYGDGRGAFPYQRRYLSGEEPIGIVAGTFDDDTLPDIAVLNKNISEGDTYTLLLATESRRFSGVEIFGTNQKPSSVATGDINGDGLTDAVIGSDVESSVQLLLSLAGGASTVRTIELGGAIAGARLADMNHDAKPDLLVASASGSLGYASGDGHGGFGTLQLTGLGNAPAGIDVADFDGDGNLDSAVTLGEDDAVAVLRGLGDGTFTAATSFSIRPEVASGDFFPVAVAARDLDGDYNVDLVVANFRDDGILSLLYGRGDGTFELPAVAMASGRRPVAVALTDLDNDGMVDIISANQDTQGMVIHRATAARTYAPPPSCCAMGKVPAALALRDVNGDGVLDALVADRTDDRVVIRTGKATSPYFSSILSSCPAPGCLDTGRTPVVLAAADFDDSGAYDVITGNNGGANVSLIRSKRSSTFVRGDANQDGTVTAADIVTLMRVLPRTSRYMVEEAVRAGRVATLAVDADGDGLVSLTDTLGVIGRLFRG